MSDIAKAELERCRTLLTSQRLERDNIFVTTSLKRFSAHFDILTSPDRGAAICLFPCILRHIHHSKTHNNKHGMYRMYSRGEQAFVPVLT